jgi:hypothetical protein
MVLAALLLTLPAAVPATVARHGTGSRFTLSYFLSTPGVDAQVRCRARLGQRRHRQLPQHQELNYLSP